MTGDQHIEDILIGQHLNRNADRTDVFYFFASAQIAHLVLHATLEDHSQNQKKHLFANSPI